MKAIAYFHAMLKYAVQGGFILFFFAWVKTQGVTIQMKATKQLFQVVLFILDTIKLWFLIVSLWIKP